MPRRLYWLKMRDDFFGRLEIKRLRKMPGGDTLVLIYERLLLLSLKSDGILTFHGYERDLAEELALDLDEEIDSVRAVLIYMQGHDLIREIEPNRYQLAGVLEMTGSESDSAERVRRYRERRAELPETVQSDCQALPASVTSAQSNGGALQSNREKETEKETEKEPEKEAETEPKKKAPAGAKRSRKAAPAETVEAESVPEYELLFAEFWKAYPNKKAKQAAVKAWKRLKPDRALFDVIMQALEAVKCSDQWSRDGGRYIPYPASWINGQRWEDQDAEVAAGSGRPNTMGVLARIIEQEKGPVRLSGFTMADPYEEEPFRGFKMAEVPADDLTTGGEE